ncbi:MAG: UDP-N-acetylmuramoyl-L-alanine--D-glutamate ligase [Bilifractor sp.]|jgi:UDP-N-acetylmuramoylalanine--D-glutamate ligase
MDFQGKKVLVFGAGKSGIDSAVLLKQVGAEPFLYDQNQTLAVDEVRGKLSEAAKQTAGADSAGIEILLGELPEDRYASTSLVVMSPGIPCDIPVVERFRSRGTPVWSEIELAWRIGKGDVYAVTGTNGKTTTTALLGKILGDYYPEVYVVGNIGSPYTGVVLKQTDQAKTVAEVSSFQLETIDEFHPRVCAITNITEDHLNRHHTMEEYIRVKERIAENQTADDLCVLNYEDEILRKFGENLKSKVVWFSSRRPLGPGFEFPGGRKNDTGIWVEGGVIRYTENGEVQDLIFTDDMQLLGLHNFENAMVAAAIALFAGVPQDRVKESIARFRGVEHRIEYVTEIRGVRYYNDSKGTNPDAAIKGIQAMNRPTLLIGGGFDKQSTYDDWINSFDGKVKWFVLIGQTREKIRDTAIACGFPADRIILCNDLRQAVGFCAEKAKNGDAVLLSPACASWGQFDNFEQRGDLFKQYVMDLF